MNILTLLAGTQNVMLWLRKSAYQIARPIVFSQRSYAIIYVKAGNSGLPVTYKWPVA